MGKKSFTSWLLDKTGAKEYVLGYIENMLSGSEIRLNNYSNEEVKFNIKKNFTWFRGDVVELGKFYKEVTPPTAYTGWRNTNFWSWVNKESKIQRVHIPVAANITQAMTSLIFSNMPKYSVISGNKDTDASLNRLVDLVFEDNDIEHICQLGIKLESYSGAIAARFVLDPDFSSTPIIQIYPMGDFEIKEKYGRLYEIQFKDIYEVGKDSYLLTSTYGKGYIKYNLYDTSKEKLKEVPLDTLKETSGLKDIYVYDNSGKLLNVLLAAYKVNKPGNPICPSSLLGASDYDGLESIFDSIDAIASLRQTYFRFGSKIKTVLTEDQVEKDPNGNIIVNDLEGLDYIILKDSNPADTSQFRDTIVPNLSQQAFEESIRDLIGQACDRCGISRTTFGIETAGRNASAEALEIRENASFRTRAEKTKLWSIFIEDLMRLSLIYSAISSSALEENKEFTKVLLTSNYDYNFTVEFPPYKPESDLERAKRIKEIESTGYISRTDAIKMYYEPILDSKAIEEKLLELNANEVQKTTEEII